MDNLHIDVTCEGGIGVQHALAIIWNCAAPGGKASHYLVKKLVRKTSYYGTPTTSHSSNLVEDPKGVETLILLWHEERDSRPLPYVLDFDKSVEFIVGWLDTVDRGPQPDHDGDNGKGWRLFTEGWGHVWGCHYAIIGVQPAWAIYGK